MTTAFLGRAAKRLSALAWSWVERRERLLDRRCFTRALSWVRPSSRTVSSPNLILKSNRLSTAGRFAER